MAHDKRRVKSRFRYRQGVDITAARNLRLRLRDRHGRTAPMPVANRALCVLQPLARRRADMEP